MASDAVLAVRARHTPSTPPQGAPSLKPQAAWQYRLLVLITGATALAGQVTWARLASAAVGGTFVSSVLTLSGAMAGLSVGAWLASGLSTRRNLLTAVLLAGGGALASFPWLLTGLAGLEGSLALRRTLAVLLLGLGNLPFGALLPLIVAGSGISKDRLATEGGALYALSALGSMIGALAVAEFLAAHVALDHLGLLLSATTLATLGLVRKARRPSPAPTKPFARSIPWLAGGTAFILGLFGMATEILWLRLLGFYWEANSLTFAWVTACTVAGLALGSWAASRIARRFHPGPRGVAGGLGAAALSLAVMAACSPSAIDAFTVWDRAVLTLCLVGLPAALFGATFVFLLNCVKGSDGGGRTFGFLAGANAAGAALAPLLLLSFSSHIAWPAHALGLIGCGYAILVPAVTALRRFEKAAGLALAAAVALMSFTWAPAGPGLESFDRRSRPSPIPGLNATVLPFQRAGLESTVTVTRNTETGTEILWIDRGSQGDTSPLGRHIPELLGRLPCELAPSPPKRAMVIGLGLGMTVSALVRHGCRSVEVAELNPQVVEANRTILAETNGRVLEEPGVRVVIEDGRTHLTDTAADYDLIVTDIVYPGMPGAGNLFSREYYALAKRRLSPKGVFVHWVPCFLLSPEDFFAVVSAFQETFPDGSGWIAFIDPRQLIVGLVGGSVSTPLPERTASRRILDPADLRRLSKAAAPIRDGDPRLEYRSLGIREGQAFGEATLRRLLKPLRRGGHTRRAWARVADARLEETEAVRNRSEGERSSLRERAGRGYAEAALLAPRLTDAELFERGHAYARRLESAAAAAAHGHDHAALESLKKAARFSRDGTGPLHLANALATRGRFEEALIELHKAQRRSPKASDIRLRQAIVLCTLREFSRAQTALEAAERLRPDRPAIFREVADWIRASSPLDTED